MARNKIPKIQWNLIRSGIFSFKRRTFAMAATKVARNIHRLYIGNLPWTIGSRELKNYFQGFGRVANASVIFDKKTGMSRGYGFVNYFSLIPIEKIENVPRHILEGNQLRIQKQ